MKKKLSILAVLLLAVAISAYSVGGTYAKYTSTYTSASSSARVAKWAFTLGKNGAALSNDFTFNLFDTIIDTKNDAAETDVAAGLIAPGTKGSFSIALYNASEVNATYSLSLALTNANNIPVEFSFDGGSTWTNNLATASAAGTLTMNAESASTVSVLWRWSYDADATIYTDRTDATDTAIGLNGTYTLSATATVTVTQVD